MKVRADLVLGEKAREPPVERVVAVVGGRAVAERHLLAGLELVVADEGQIVVGKRLLLAGDRLDDPAAIVVEAHHLAVGVGEVLDAVPGVVAVERGEHRVRAGDGGLGRGADFLHHLAQGAVGARERSALGAEHDDAIRAVAGRARRAIGVGDVVAGELGIGDRRPAGRIDRHS